ncbi:MAG: hypothetical protein LC640_10235 [Frankia sp.]|nr:hypothetical protein [Frankia sp.]
MPQIRTIERRIRALEGFAVKITTPDGADVRSDKQVPAQYDGLKNRAAASLTVEAWKRSRFRPRFPGYDCEVQMADGTRVHGGTKLQKVRDSYS